MTQTVRSELLRMLGMFAETDPRSIEYTQLMRNFEILSSQMDMYGEVEELLSEEAESRVAKVDNVIEFPVKACTDAGTDADADERETGADIVGSRPPSESAPAEDRETKPQETPVSEEAAPSKAVVSQPGIILPPPETDVSQPDVNPPPETGAHPEVSTSRSLCVSSAWRTSVPSPPGATGSSCSGWRVRADARLSCAAVAE